jgi:hypothetical protein
MYDNDSKEPIGKSILNFNFFQPGATTQEKSEKKNYSTFRYAGEKEKGKSSYFSNFKMDLHRNNELKAKITFF